MLGGSPFRVRGAWKASIGDRVGEHVRLRAPISSKVTKVLEIIACLVCVRCCGLYVPVYRYTHLYILLLCGYVYCVIIYIRRGGRERERVRARAREGERERERKQERVRSA